MANSSSDQLITASFTIPEKIKERIEKVAAAQDLNSSQVVRRILVEHFAKLDTLAEATDQQPAPTTA